MKLKENRILLIVLPLILLVCFGLWSILATERYASVHSDTGVWDLRDFDFSQANVRIGGPVEFIPDALLTPEDFAAREGEAGLGTALETAQYATSRIRLLVPDGYYTFSRISTDFTDRIFVNGVWLYDAGTPADNRESNVPFTQRVTFTARPVNGMIEIVQQNTNFVHRAGGFPQDWRVGAYGFYNTILQADYTVNILLGCYLALFLIFMLLFFLFLGYKASLYFALFCLTWFLRSGATGSRVFAALMPWLSGPASLRIEYIAMPIAAVLTIAIINELFPKLLHKLFLRTLYILSAVFAMLFMLVDTLSMSYVILVCEGIYLLCILYILVRFAMKLRGMGLVQIIFISGMVVFLYAAVRDFFYYSWGDILPPFANINLTQIAMLAFAFCEAAAVFISTMNEVEKAKENERTLAAENAALDRVNRLRMELMTTISHEARTPLAVLASYSGLVSMELRTKGVDAQTASDLDKIAFEAKRVAGLIDGLKRMTLHSEETAKRTSLDFGEIILQTARLYRHIMERSGVELVTNIEENLPPVFGNPEELTQVPFNLLQNAKNHTQRGSVTVTAKREGDTVAVSVTDTGAGISPELLPHVFERGIHGSRDGTGIGLAICREVVEAHGGTIQIESKQSEGAAVTFALPIYKEATQHGK